MTVQSGDPERTTPKAKSDRLDLTRATNANLSPVWGLSLTAGLTAGYAVCRSVLRKSRYHGKTAVTPNVYAPREVVRSCGDAAIVGVSARWPLVRRKRR